MVQRRISYKQLNLESRRLANQCNSLTERGKPDDFLSVYDYTSKVLLRWARSPVSRLDSVHKRTVTPCPCPRLQPRTTHCSELRMASSPAGRGSSLRSDASSTIEPSGCGGLNERSWTSSCSLITDEPAAAAINPRNGGDGFNGRVQNSGCAWKPTKYGCSAHTRSRQWRPARGEARDSPGSSSTCMRSPRSSLPTKRIPLAERRSMSAGLTSYR